jgi:hypothetical protein
MSKNIPSYFIGTSTMDGCPLVLPPDAPIYSSYTHNLIGYGSIPVGTPSDSPNGGVFHVIDTDILGNHMAHWAPTFGNGYSGFGW